MLRQAHPDCRGETGRPFWNNGQKRNAPDSTARSLSHVTDWVFDLDNTLYPRECNLFAQIDLLITDYMVDVTRCPLPRRGRLQKAYYRDYGTTLNGLMQRHQVDPDHFLSTVHDIDYSPVPRIRTGRGDRRAAGAQVHPHQWRCRPCPGRAGAAGRRRHCSTDIFDIRAMSYRPKPMPRGL